MKRTRLIRNIITVEGLKTLYREVYDMLLSHPTGIQCKIKVISDAKTPAQLRYLYGVIYPEIQSYMLQDGNEYSIDYIDMFFKDKFLYDYDDTGVKIIRSKALSDKEEIMAYIDSIIRWCGEQGWDISCPFTTGAIKIKKIKG